MDGSWRVVRVLPSCEKKVADHLTARLVDNYLPVIVEESEWSDRKVLISRPLLPGYIFVRFTRSQKVLILSTPGIIRNGLGEAIPNLDLERIRTALREGYKLAPYLGRAEGTRVSFRTGIFSGAEGIGSKVGEDRCRVVLALSSSQQLFSVESEVGALDVLDEHAPLANLKKPRITGDIASGRSTLPQSVDFH